MLNLLSYASFGRIRNYLLIFFFSSLCLLSRGQPVSLSFLEDSVAVVHGETFSNTLLVTNHLNEPVLLKKSRPDSFALIRLPDTLYLNPGEKKEVFVKYLASAALIRAMGNKINIRYDAAQKNISAAASFFIFNQTGQQLLVSTVNPVNYLNMQTHEGNVQVKCINNGYTDITVRLRLRSYPEGLEINDNDKMITLPPGGQQLLHVVFRSRLSQNLTSDFNLSVLALDPATGKELAATYTKVLVLSNEKRALIASTTDAALINNSAQLSYWNADNGLSYYQLAARGAVEPAAGNALRYHLNLNYYTRPFSGAEMYDSWISYKNRHLGIQIGSISENLDYSLFGSGVKLSFFPDSANTVSGYYMKNNYLIFSAVNNQRDAATIWAANYTHATERNTSSLSYLNGSDPFTGVQTNLVNGKSGWELKGDQSLELEAGYSRELLLSDQQKAHNGYAGGLRYRYHSDKWSILSDNYYSTPYYSGLRRGALLLQEHVDYRVTPHKHIFAHYEVVNNTPRYEGRYYPAFFNTKTAQYQLGFATAMNRWLVNLRSYFYTQALRQKILSTDLALRSASWHAAADISYSINRHGFMFSGDYGRVKSNNPYLPGKNYSVLQGKFNYSFNQMGFNALVQYNPFYLIQEPLPWQQGKFRQYSLGPYFRFSFFDKRLELEASDNLSYYGYYLGGWSNTAQGRAIFSFQNTWQAAAQVIYNSYEQYRGYNFLQTQVSITKSFMQKNAPGYKSLSVLFFGDKNADGIWNKDEYPVENVIAMLDQSLAQSDRKGKISFTNLEPSAHKLRIENGNGWWLMTPVDIFLKHNQTLKIALVKTAAVSGKVVNEGSRFIQDALDLEGITVIAAGSQGERFTTITDAEGNFSFNLPAKLFSFTTETQNSGQFIANQPQSVNVKETGNPPVIFHLSDQSRKIDIKQF
ncbi:carboxypeptidase-like regulatory domain-containing protein [Niabella pedocola]|uniref:Carboxypeptidase-like regulatory domain-containing protein n=1 Tax=Niabella pedocola TaxID=1752077 RepID=A0ABS8PKL5_9BACT|nr:carboxypeptidase-like regulatory domain-containing protein [Niabella pedocola]MCD2421420.1 carboxypeptidase-like regulatory domain-containing protein [Niabella pedocola]